MSAADDAKRTALRKMQLGATALLMGMLALMFVSAMQAAAHPWLHWVRALAEAGAIGATSVSGTLISPAASPACAPG
ncbi:MAG TPA: hypothetical protein VML58_02970, partial [Burkholderiaceae bacterium]|nr:hypothetical protein [Burkholderiaceae bacterium]